MINIIGNGIIRKHLTVGRPASGRDEDFVIGAYRRQIGVSPEFYRINFGIGKGIDDKGFAPVGEIISGTDTVYFPHPVDVDELRVGRGENVDIAQQRIGVQIVHGDFPLSVGKGIEVKGRNGDIRLVVIHCDSFGRFPDRHRGNDLMSRHIDFGQRITDQEGDIYICVIIECHPEWIAPGREINPPHRRFGIDIDDLNLIGSREEDIGERIPDDNLVGIAEDIGTERQDIIGDDIGGEINFRQRFARCVNDIRRGIGGGRAGGKNQTNSENSRLP